MSNNSYQSLAVRKRPQTFADVVEQSVSVKILEEQIKQRKFKNCYGFFGKSGSGKTTVARIFAKEINQGIGEPIEFDAGAMGSVDNVRAILDDAKQRVLVGEYKIFIIDEAQNLGGGSSKAAWSALLKGLEECPKYTIFILCSTDPQKIPEAILNRLQRFNFTPISQKGIYNRLVLICTQEGYANYEKVCDIISKSANGSMRNAISFLEQVASFSEDLSIDVAKTVLGGMSYETLFNLTWALQNKDSKAVIEIVDGMYNSGQDLKTFLDTYIDFVLNLIKYVLFNNIDATNLPAYLLDGANAIKYTVELLPNSLEYFNFLVDNLIEIKSKIKLDQDYKTTIEIMLLQIARG